MQQMDRFHEQLETLKSGSNYRQLPPTETMGLFDLCSNDYLGINADKALRRDFLENHNHNFEFGSGSSRLLSKSMEQHVHFEQCIAAAYQKEAALVFNSGYHANVGLISALPGKRDLIIADKLIHASVIDGAKLSQADFKRYRHLSYSHLDEILTKYRHEYEHVFIISESIFSMDGDVADIQKLVAIKERHDCWLYIDEAHALGIRGAYGLGCVEEQNCTPSVDFIVGTMGKAMGSMGAFVACKQLFKDYLINHSRAFIFSTALPPVSIAWSRFVFEKMQLMSREREHLAQLSRQFAKSLGVQSDSHIIPFIIGSNDNALQQSEALKKQGYNVLPVRYPTVPKGTARLRFSLSANMNLEHLEPIQKLLNPTAHE